MMSDEEVSDGEFTSTDSTPQAACFLRIVVSILDSRIVKKFAKLLRCTVSDEPGQG